LLFFYEGHNFHGAPGARGYFFQLLIFDRDILAIVVFIAANHFGAFHIALANGVKKAAGANAFYILDEFDGDSCARYARR